MSTFTQVGSDGSLEKYEDTFADVSQEDIEEAEKLERQILDYNGSVNINYLKMSAALSRFKSKALYKARGYTSFQLWADSPELQGLSYRTAQKLVIIADELIPIFVKHNLVDRMPSMSVLYDLLPILNDDDSESKILEAFNEIQGLTVRDAKKTIKRIRGLPSGTREEPYFKAVATLVGNAYKVDIWCIGSQNGTYEVSRNAFILVADWPRFEALFKGFVEVR